jgi:Uma2 family endonuclease
MPTAAPIARDPDLRSVELSGISWKGYESLLREIGDRLIYVTYDQGRMEIMSPSISHEESKELIGALIEILAEELNLPIFMLGSSTFKRKDLRKGLEPDKCYYIQNQARIRGRTRLNLPKDPPPDLVVEVDISHHGIERERLYAAMGVPEIWRYRGLRLEALWLEDGDYHDRSTSRAFARLPMGDVNRFVKMGHSVDATTIRRAFRKWVRTHYMRQSR